MAFKALCLSMLFVTIASTRTTNRPKVFNVKCYSAKFDGETDNANIQFVGPCKNQIEFVTKGTLFASANPRDIKKDMCINFRYINDLYISGAGTLNCQGKQFGPLNDCHKNSNCPKLAMLSLLFDFKPYYNEKI
ncbi:unnamed protein product [Thlaspi arvense]|uniref:Uncharacterized protein n=1 Tax=Thlaspi arvense TaxID=13288 RepID=A0AAU9T9Q3_THLAR|nr:unnamed protein product [Thlaspi arvense]